jgi:hypothetical protein
MADCTITAPPWRANAWFEDDLKSDCASFENADWNS